MPDPTERLNTGEDPRFNRQALLASALLCLMLPGCGTGDAGSESSRFSVERELVIGSVDDPDQALTTVGNLTVDAVGTIFDMVLDRFHARRRLLLSGGRN